ncbi:MAG: GNAT family N-acetyltransferase, partial [Pseudomonadota bacterium]
ALDGLRHPSVTVFAAWQGDRLAGIGALKDLGGGHGEIKSMHTAEGMRGLGAGRAVLNALLEEARARRYTRVSLETGVEEAFAAARRLYAAHGFAPCPPFGHYTEDPNSLYMTATLTADARP